MGRSKPVNPQEVAPVGAASSPLLEGLASESGEDKEEVDPWLRSVHMGSLGMGVVMNVLGFTDSGTPFPTPTMWIP